MNLNIGSATNPIDTALNTWAKLAAIDNSYQDQAWQKQQRERQTAEWQREDQRRGLMVIDPADSGAVASATGIPTAKPVRGMGMAGELSGAIPQPVAQAALQAEVGPPNMADPDTAARLKRFGDMLQAKNQQDYQEYIQGLELAAQGKGAEMTPNAAKLIMREVVNNPAYDEMDPGGQLLALKSMAPLVEQIRDIKSPVRIEDPATLAAVSKAFPHLTGKSNLKDAQPRALFITPDPSGDPMKARIAVGLQGTDEAGKPVQGVVTVNRSSSPDDVVYNATTGEWLTKAQSIQKNTEALLQARAKLGDAEAFKTYAQLRKGKAVAAELEQLAGRIEDPDEAAVLKMQARMAMLGNADPDTVLKSAMDIFHGQAQITKELKMIPKKVDAEYKAKVSTPSGKAEEDTKVLTATESKAKIEGENAAAQGLSAAGMSPSALKYYKKAQEDKKKEGLELQGKQSDIDLKKSHQRYYDSLARLSGVKASGGGLASGVGAKPGQLPAEAKMIEYLVEGGMEKQAATDLVVNKDKTRLRNTMALETIKARNNAMIQPGDKGYKTDDEIIKDTQSLVDKLYPDVKPPAPAGGKPALSPKAQAVLESSGFATPKAPTPQVDKVRGKFGLTQPQAAPTPPQPDTTAALREQVQRLEMAIPRATNVQEKQRLIQQYQQAKEMLDSVNRQMMQRTGASAAKVIGGMAPTVVNRGENGQVLNTQRAWQAS